MLFTPEQTNRFWAKVDTSRPESCWEWRGSLSEKGYGLWGYTKTATVKAHRAAYTIAKGSIPDGLVVMHQCDNRRCCNPSHLEAGTQFQNLEDMRKKGRGSKPPCHIGELSPKAKLTLRQVKAIRASSEPVKIQAQKYGVSISTIYAAKSGQNWSKAA